MWLLQLMKEWLIPIVTVMRTDPLRIWLLKLKVLLYYKEHIAYIPGKDTAAIYVMIIPQVLCSAFLHDV